MAISKFSVENIKALRSQLDAALVQVAEKSGIKIKVGSASFNDGQVTFKLECLAISEGGQTYSPEAEAFKVYAVVVGLKESDLGRSFSVDGNVYTIVGFKARSRSKPIIAAGSDGRSYKFSTESVQRALVAGAVA